MNAKKKSPPERSPAEEKLDQKLTEGEISVVQMLWDKGPLALSEAHDEMCRRGPKIGYTTVQTRLERLVEKQVVAKTSDRPAKYRAAINPGDVSAPLLDLLLEKVSGVVPLFAHLIQTPSLTTDDLAEMKRLIAEAEKTCNDTPRKSEPK
jgi:BlaI family penicillinase repressor